MTSHPARWETRILSGMHLLAASFREFKRFIDLSITGLPTDTDLVVMAGPNGTGKSSVFDGFRTWQGRHLGSLTDPLYFDKAGGDHGVQLTERVQVQFDEAVSDVEAAKRAIYVRTAYRHEPDFTTSSIGQMPRLLDLPRPYRMIEQETSVSQNYQQLVGQTFAGLFNPSNDTMAVRDLRELLIGEVQASMGRVFPDLQLQGVLDPVNAGSFYFQKGRSHGWHYKNLSGGEKAAFDLLLDFLIKRPAYNNTVYCIDEPEVHLNTQVQGLLLRELLSLMYDGCQLWVASHSIGMMREAWRLAREDVPVVFLEFGESDFERSVNLTPITPSRKFWVRVLSVAIGELADLVAPRDVVLVEGRPRTTGGGRGNVEFDARCLRTIFSDHRPESGFISVGGSADVQNDRLALGEGIQALVPGASVIRLIDRDGRTDQEVAALQRDGCRVLAERDLENYLLSDEIIQKLCERQEQPTMGTAVVREKARLLSEVGSQGRPADDIKAITGALYEFIKRTLSLVRPGSNKSVFLADVMSPLITQDTATYARLEKSIFG